MIGRAPTRLHLRLPDVPTRRAALVVLAGVGAALLLVVAATSWFAPSDEAAYWRAGERLLGGVSLYDPSAPANTPYAYWYPPVLAQALAPLTAFVPETLFSVAWTVLLLGCLLFLADGDLLVALALVAFVPVAVELRVRNVHLILAALMVLALRVSSWFWIPAAAIKLSPVLGLVYLAASGRIREALRVAAVGLGVVAILVALSPQAWRDFVQLALARGATDGGSLVPVPFLVRLAIGATLAVIAGRVRGRRGEVILVVAITVANPTFWMTAFSLLVAAVPLIRGFRIAPAPRSREVPALQELPRTG